MREGLLGPCGAPKVIACSCTNAGLRASWRARHSGKERHGAIKLPIMALLLLPRLLHSVYTNTPVPLPAPAALLTAGGAARSAPGVAAHYPHTTHRHPMRCSGCGAGCGYRNIQMQLSNLLLTREVRGRATSSVCSPALQPLCTPYTPNTSFSLHAGLQQVLTRWPGMSHLTPPTNALALPPPCRRTRAACCLAGAATCLTSPLSRPGSSAPGLRGLTLRERSSWAAGCRAPGAGGGLGCGWAGVRALVQV